MKTIKAPDGYYYKKDSIYTTEINLPDGFSEEGWELVTEAEYQEYQREREARMLEEELGMRRGYTAQASTQATADPVATDTTADTAEEGAGV